MPAMREREHGRTRHEAGGFSLVAVPGVREQLADEGGEIMCNYCGDCVHWHEWESERNDSCRRGDCDKIAKGTPFSDGRYTYDGYSFNDECYDDDFQCFEPKE